MSQILTYAYQLALVVLGVIVLLIPTLILPPVRNLVIERALGTMIEAATRKTREANRERVELEEKRQKVREALTELASAVAVLTSANIPNEATRAANKALTAIATIRLYCRQQDQLTVLETRILNLPLGRIEGNNLLQLAIREINYFCLRVNTISPQ